MEQYVIAVTKIKPCAHRVLCSEQDIQEYGALVFKGVAATAPLDLLCPATIGSLCLVKRLLV